MRPRLFAAALGAGLVAVGLPTMTTASVAQDTVSCDAPADPLTFEMDYIDTGRAGGEPLMELHPDGQLLWGSHAGTTHFYSPAAASPTTTAFGENYTGQTYYYRSDDGETWTFVPRDPVTAAAPVLGIPATGFSDPEFAIEQDGTVYVSEINLANVAVYRSEDGGSSYELRNVFSFTVSDRQWMAADGDGELYMTANGFGGGPFPGTPVQMTGHFMAKSTDGGQTFGAASRTNDNGIGDIQIDHDRGILYELSVAGGDNGVVSMARFPNIRDEDTDFTVEIFDIADNVGLTGVQRLIDSTFDMDANGNLYVTWFDNGAGGNAQGVYYSYSTDQGETWAERQRIDPDDFDAIWPWISVGDEGQVAIAWLQSDQMTDGTLPGQEGGTTALWNVMVAHTTNGLGCDGGAPPFTVQQASSEPVHTGTICQGGTLCQAQAIDRRLGDYFSVIHDADGGIHVAVSDTRQGGGIALPLHIRQSVVADTDPAPTTPTTNPAPATPTAAPAPTSSPTTAAAPTTSTPMPVTGGGAVLLGLVLLGGAALSRRRG